MSVRYQGTGGHRPVYECQRYTFPWIEDEQRTIDVQETHEFRYYFRLDRDTPDDDSGLRAQSETNLAALQQRVDRNHATILDVVGYTSPEATERHCASGVPYLREARRVQTDARR